MSNFFNYLSTNSSCYVCKSSLDVVVAGKVFNKNKLSACGSLKFKFNLLSRLHGQSSEDYFYYFTFYKDSNSFDVSFFKKNETIEYVPFNLIDLFFKQKPYQKMNIFLYCAKCKNYSVSSCLIKLDYSKSICGKIKKGSEFICIEDQDNKVFVENDYSNKQTDLSISQINDNGLGTKIQGLPLIRKNKNVKLFKNKVMKYLMLI